MAILMHCTTSATGTLSNPNWTFIIGVQIVDVPYRRQMQPPAAEHLVSAFERAIKSLVQRFRNHPYAFYTESDMHCYLYHRLYEGGMMNGLYRMADGHETILLHKEHPTTARYRRSETGRLEEDALGRRRGAFDLCIWDPQFISTRNHRQQRVLCAAELALDECRPDSVHTINDSTKLAGATNEIKYGYLLFFVRDRAAYERNQAEVEKNLADAATRVRVAFAMTDGHYKPKPRYLGAWGVV